MMDNGCTKRQDCGTVHLASRQTQRAAHSSISESRDTCSAQFPEEAKV